jgi:hypothetical protein
MVPNYNDRKYMDQCECPITILITMLIDPNPVNNDPDYIINLPLQLILQKFSITTTRKKGPQPSLLCGGHLFNNLRGISLNM